MLVKAYKKEHEKNGLKNNPFLFRTASYSWLGFHRVQRKAGLPAYLSTFLPSSRITSDIWQELLKYGDEFVQDSHLFPFSPKPTKSRFDTFRFIFNSPNFITYLAILQALRIKNPTAQGGFEPPTSVYETYAFPTATAPKAYLYGYCIIISIINDAAISITSGFATKEG